MSTSPAIAGCQFEPNRPLSDSAQELCDSANSVRDNKIFLVRYHAPPFLEVDIDISSLTIKMNIYCQGLKCYLLFLKKSFTNFNAACLLFILPDSLEYSTRLRIDLNKGEGVSPNSLIRS